MEKFMKKSKVITFIGGFYIFGGIISFLSLLLGGSPLNTVFDCWRREIATIFCREYLTNFCRKSRSQQNK